MEYELTGEEDAAILSYRAYRDSCALRLGALLHDYERNKMALIENIDDNRKAEEYFVEQLLKTRGADPKRDWRYKTGKLVDV